MFTQAYNYTCRAEGVKLTASSSLVATFDGNIQFLAGAPKVLADGSMLVEMIVRDYASLARVNGGDVHVKLDEGRQDQAPASSYKMNRARDGGRHELNMYLLLDSASFFPGKVLRSKGVARLSVDAPMFPPVNRAYQLEGAIEFEDPANPGPVLAKIETFPVILDSGS